MWATYLYKASLWLAPALVASFVAFGFGFVFFESLPFLRSVDWSGTLSVKWFPSDESYGLIALMSGTVFVVVCALVISLPIAFGAAIELAFFVHGPLRSACLGAVGWFAGVPAVVVGLFGLVYVVPALGNWFGQGFGLAAASIVLLMILVPPTVLQLTETLQAETEGPLLAARSLGLSQARAVWKVVLPAKTFALAQSAMLAASRGVAETLAILMVAGNVVNLPVSFFESFRTINATIALEMPYALDVHRSSLFFLGLLTFVLVWLLRWMSGAFKKRPGLS